jgi:hypothetical protein
MPAKPSYSEKVNGYLVHGSGKDHKTGHMVGGAIDVANWRQFLPYAEKYGLSWMGKKDPVHFQINDRFKVPGSGAKIADDGEYAKQSFGSKIATKLGFHHTQKSAAEIQVEGQPGGESGDQMSSEHAAFFKDLMGYAEGNGPKPARAQASKGSEGLVPASNDSPTIQKSNAKFC